MVKFALFKKSTKFSFGVNPIIYLLIFCLLGMGYLGQRFFHLENNLFERIFQLIAISGLFVALIVKFMGFSKIERFDGVFYGYLIFKANSIVVNAKSYNLAEIKRIEISNDDYSGKLVNVASGNFGPALSNGTNNYIIIFLNSGETKKFNFQLIDSNDFQNLRNEFINYHVNSKMDFWSLANILGEKSSKEIAELTTQIQMSGTSSNSQ